MEVESNTKRQNQKADQFRLLHQENEMLVVANAWDVVSSKVFESAGFPAIATTSSGISWSCGYRDIEHIPPPLMVDMIRRIARHVNVPVTADVEGGYFRDAPGKLSSFFADVIDAGAIGINLEDSSRHQTGDIISIEDQITRIKIARETAEKKGINLFINARTDVMVHTGWELGKKIDVCIKRVDAFKTAGADGAFIPFVYDMEVVRTLKKDIKLPLNILATETLDVNELRKLKVNRLSVGSRPILATMNLLMKIAQEMRLGNYWPTLFTRNFTYAEVNDWFE